MNDTVNLPKLINRIAAQTGVDPTKVRRFLHALFLTIEEGLDSGEKVQVKGVGEFVRTDNVDDPILFIPDERLAEIANEPFAAFSAVELNDGVTEDDLAVADQEVVANVSSENVASETLEPKPEYQPEPAPMQQNVAPESAPELRPESDPKQAAQQESESKPETEPVSEQEQAQESEPQLELEQKSVSVSEPESEPESTSVSESQEESEAPEAQEEQEESEAQEELKDLEVQEVQEDPQSVRDEYESVQTRDGGSHAMYVVLGILIGLIIGLVAGFFAGRTMSRYWGIDDDYAATDSVPNIFYVPEEDTVTVNDIDTTKSEVVAPVQDEPEIPAAQPEKKATSVVEEPVYDTVTGTRYLSILARDHYGKKNYWIFIYNANPGLGNPNKIAPGTRVLIPAKSTFAESTDAATDAKAQRLLNEISKRYKL